MKSLGTIGCVVGLLGVFAAVLAHHVIARRPELPPSWELNVDVSDKLQWRYGNAPPPRVETAATWRDSVMLTAVAIGCVAIAFAVGSWIRREGVTLGMLATFLGIAAIAWEQVLLVFALFVFAGGPMFWFQWAFRDRGKTSRAA